MKSLQSSEDAVGVIAANSRWCYCETRKMSAWEEGSIGGREAQAGYQDRLANGNFSMGLRRSRLRDREIIDWPKRALRKKISVVVGGFVKECLLGGKMRLEDRMRDLQGVRCQFGEWRVQIVLSGIKLKDNRLILEVAIFKDQDNQIYKTYTDN